MVSALEYLLKTCPGWPFSNGIHFETRVWKRSRQLQLQRLPNSSKTDKQTNSGQFVHIWRGHYHECWLQHTLVNVDQTIPPGGGTRTGAVGVGGLLPDFPGVSGYKIAFPSALFGRLTSRKRRLFAFSAGFCLQAAPQSTKTNWKCTDDAPETRTITTSWGKSGFRGHTTTIAAAELHKLVTALDGIGR